MDSRLMAEAHVFGQALRITNATPDDRLDFGRSAVREFRQLQRDMQREDEETRQEAIDRAVASGRLVRPQR